MGQRFLSASVLAVVLICASSNALAQTNKTQSSSADASAATGQSTGAEPDQNPTFKVNVKLVPVRVVVRDQQGHAVENLKKEDFQVFDKGKPQVISQFAIDDSGNPKSGIGGSSAPRHYVAYVFDDEHLKFANLADVVDTAKRYLQMLPASSEAAVLTTSGKTMLDFTTDRAKFDDALSHIRSAGMPSTTDSNACPDISVYQADMIVNKNDRMAMAAAIQDYRNCFGGAFSGNSSASRASASQGFSMGKSSRNVEQTIRGIAQRILMESEVPGRQSVGLLKNVVKAMSHEPGQRTVVFISPGFVLPELQSSYDEIVERAVRAQIVVNTIDARGVYVPGFMDASQSRSGNQYETESDLAVADILSGLAEDTGGVFVHGTNDFLDAFRRTSGTAEYAYVLGFAPQDLKNDGKFHPLRVTLKGKRNVTVQARRGYFAPSKNDNPVEEAKSELKDELFLSEELHDLPVELRLEPGKTAEGHPQLKVLAHVDLKHLQFRKVDGQNHNVLTCDYGLFDEKGGYVQGTQKVITLNLKDESLEAHADSGLDIDATFDVQPGRYTVRLVARDEEGQLTSAETGTAIVP
ncbi:MAG TPA: VWA domain-containing protein [Terriglobales bacterium]|nr:VWA domain-containing protein [Terriglobales bacterium]